MCLFWIIWKEINRRVFNDVEQSDQTIKSDFMYIFLGWVGMYIEDQNHPLAMFDFVQ